MPRPLRLLAAVLALLLAAPAFASAPPFAAFEAWRQRYLQAPAEAQRALVEEGVALAGARREALAALLRKDPKAALTEAVASDGLPPRVAALLEERVDVLGRFEVLCARVPGGRAPPERWAVLGERRARVEPFGDWTRLRTVDAVRLRGLVLDGQGAFDDSAVPRSLLDPLPSAWTVGQKKVLFIRVDFSDAPGDPLGQTAADSLLAQLNAFLRDGSASRTTTVATVTPTLRLPLSKAQYASQGSSKLLADARSAAANNGYPGTSYDLDVVAFSRVSTWGWAGLGYVGARGTWLNGSFTNGTLSHEVGHNLGLRHANLWRAPGDTITGAGSSLEYGDAFDIMGDGDGHYNAWYKADLDWFSPGEAVDVTASGTHQVWDLEAFVSGGVHGLRVPIGATRDYWVEFRPQRGGAAQRGAIVRWGYPSARESDLLDMAPWTAAATDAPLPIGRTFSDVTAGIHVTPTGLKGTTPESLDVVVNRGLFAGNRAPTVQLSATATQVAPGTNVVFTAAAADADGDALAYFWDFGDGSASANQSTAQRSWSQARDVLARVTVTDMRGGTGTAAVVVRVGAPSTLRISGRVVEGAAGVEGARVYSGTKFTVTDTQGNYTLVGLPAGSYSLAALKPGFSVTPDFTNPVVLSTANATNKDFTASRATYALAGTVTSQGAPVAGVTVSAGPYVTVTDGAGTYTLRGVPNGAYNLLAQGPAGEAYAPSGFGNPVVVNGANQTGRNFIELVFPLSGEVTGGGGGPHTVTDGVRSTSTSLNGGKWTWTLQKVPPGKWNLVALKAGEVLTPAFAGGRANPVEVTNAGITGLDFSAAAGTVYRVGGLVTEAGAPLVGATVTTGSQSAQTDSLGRYVLPNVAPGGYTLTPSHPQVTLFTPATRSVTVASADLLAEDFAVANANAPPRVAIPPHAAVNPVTTTYADLTVMGDDDKGEGDLAYTWASSFGPAAVTFSLNGTNGAKDTRVTFTQPGAYGFEVTLKDSGNLSVQAGTAVLVVPQTQSLAVTSSGSVVEVGASMQFVATSTDQFGATAPVSGDATWSVDGGGTISSTGRFTATAPGSFTVTAELDGRTGTKAISVVVGPVPRIVQAPAADPNPVDGDTTRLTVVADDDEGEAGLTYTWSAVNPPGTVTFTPNGTNAAKSATAVFGAVGSYPLQVEVTDARGLSASGFVTVVVRVGLTRLELVPQVVNLPRGGTQQFVLRGFDQAGAAVALPACTWDATGGTVDGSGLFTAGTDAGSFAVTATCGLKTARASVSIGETGEGPTTPKGCGCTAGADAPLWVGLGALAALRRRRRSGRQEA